jgi:ketosteroid isomerase-like protein
LGVLLGTFAITSAWADDVADVVAANKSYEQAFSSLDIKAIDAAWAHDADVTVIHPSSKLVLIGWDAVRKSYADQPARHKDFSVAMDSPHVTVSSNVGLVVGVEKVHTVLTNGEVADLSIMATSVYEKRDGKWLLVHHHGSRMPQ